jgi:hypothetical protein
VTLSQRPFDGTKEAGFEHRSPCSGWLPVLPFLPEITIRGRRIAKSGPVTIPA